MVHHRLQIFFLLYVIAPHQHEASLFSRRAPESHRRIRLHLEDDEHLIIPKHATVKILHPISSSYSLIPKPPKKYPNHLVGKLTLPDGWKLTDSVKNNDKEVVALEELFRPVTLHEFDLQHHRPDTFDDVKPVTEHIEDDLKYDFRTKTHSI